VISLLIEGIESLRLPCSWVLLIPGIAITVFGRRRSPLVVATFALAAMVVAWLRFSGWWFAVPHGAVQVLLGFSIIVSAAVAWRLDRGAFDVLTAAITGISAAWSWIPCVGPHLGNVLNGSRTEPFEHIGGTIAFLAGQFLPFILVAALGVAAPTLQQRLEHRAVISAGAVLLALVGLLFVTTLFDDIASELARRSTF